MWFGKKMLLDEFFKIVLAAYSFSSETWIVVCLVHRIFWLLCFIFADLQPPRFVFSQDWRNLPIGPAQPSSFRARAGRSSARPRDRRSPSIAGWKMANFYRTIRWTLPTGPSIPCRNNTPVFTGSRGERLWRSAEPAPGAQSCPYVHFLTGYDKIIHLWTWLSWRGKSKLPNEHPLEHCVKQQAIIGRFPPLFLASLVWQPVERAACCDSSSSISNSTFPGLGFESQSRQLFVLWLQWQLILINQSINRKSYSKNSLHWLTVRRKLGEGKKRKKDLDWDLNPRPGTPDLETWNLRWNWHNILNCSTRSTRCQTTLERKRGKAPYDCLLHDTVFQWVFIKQLALSASR